MLSLDSPSRAQIERICRNFGDETTMEVFSRLYIIKKAGLFGRAHKHLSHFLDGKGTPLRFDFAALLSDVPRVQDHIVSEIRKAYRTGRRNGRVLVEQRHYHALTQGHFDWQLALGGFIVAWRPVGNRSNAFGLTVLNSYQWHAEDRERTKCIHEAGERLNRHGKARNFMMIGETVLEFDPKL